MAKKNEVTTPQQEDPSSKIEAIKNLIFGENIQEYNSEFEKIKGDILKKQKELSSLVDEVRTELMQNVDNLSTDLNIRITELENTLNEKADELQHTKVDRQMLGDMLVNLGEKIRD